MERVYEARAPLQNEIRGTLAQPTAQICSAVFGQVCKVIWPVKAAEHLAAEVGCSVRAAAYQISGQSDPSAQSLIVVINHLVLGFKRGNGNGNASYRGNGKHNRRNSS